MLYVESNNGRIFWVRRTPDLERNTKLIGSWSRKTSEVGDSTFIYREGEEDSWVWKCGEVVVGSGEMDFHGLVTVQYSFWSFPHSYLILPCVFLSAYLILRSPSKALKEPGSNS